MTPVEILEKIIQNNGDCIWAQNHPTLSHDEICDICPLGKNIKGEKMCCIERLLKKDKEYNWDEYNALYLKEAKRLLIDLLTEELLIGLK